MRACSAGSTVMTREVPSASGLPGHSAAGAAAAAPTSANSPAMADQNRIGSSPTAATAAASLAKGAALYTRAYPTANKRKLNRGGVLPVSPGFCVRSEEVTCRLEGETVTHAFHD